MQSISSCENTHKPLPRNTKQKTNDVYIKLLDTCKPCNCNAKENTVTNVNSNGYNSSNVNGEVERRRRTKEK